MIPGSNLKLGRSTAALHRIPPGANAAHTLVIAVDHGTFRCWTSIEPAFQGCRVPGRYIRSTRASGPAGHLVRNRLLRSLHSQRSRYGMTFCTTRCSWLFNPPKMLNQQWLVRRQSEMRRGDRLILCGDKLLYVQGNNRNECFDPTGKSITPVVIKNGNPFNSKIERQVFCRSSEYYFRGSV